MRTQWECPRHKTYLRTVEDYEGALVCDYPGCYEIFTVLDSRLCVLDGNKWKDTKTGKYKEVKGK